VSQLQAGSEHEQAGGGGLGLAVILVTSALLKLALLAPAHQTIPIGDARDYLVAARSFQAGEYTSIRPPLWPATLWLATEIAEATGGPEARTPIAEILPGRRSAPRGPLSDLDWARLLMVAMSTLSVWLAFLLGRELLDVRSGLVGAALFAFDPVFVGYTHLLWAETQFTLLNLAWALLLVLGVKRERLGLLCAAGLLLGAAALTRQLIMSFSVVAAAWIFLVQPHPPRRAARMAAAFALFSVLAVAPWTIRNAVVHERFVPIAPIFGWSLLHGVTDDVAAEVVRAGIAAGVNREAPIPPIETERLARERALAIIAEDPGGYAARMVMVNLPDTWKLGSRVLEHVRHGEGAGATRQHGYGPVPGWLGLGLIALVCGVYVLGMVAGLIGLAVAPRWQETLLVGGLLLHSCALNAIVGDTVRHRLYVMPFVLLYAGFALTRRRSEWRTLVTRGRVAVAAALLGVFVLLLAAADHGELREQWLHFRVRAQIAG
jgi:4-amino-4-deoxy-L-arabinose transferase-like glycosyltransferase